MLQESNMIARKQRSEAVFDEAAFYKAVQGRLSSEGLSWRELGRRLELSSSTFSRLARGRRPDIDTFLRLLSWLEMPARAFVRGVKAKGGSKHGGMSMIATTLRQDPTLRPEDVGPIEDIVRVAYNRFRSRR